MSESTNPHFDTPKKAKILGAVEYMEAKGIHHYKQDIFDFFGVSKARGWAIIKEDSARRHHNRADIQKDHRGRHPKLSAKDIHRVDQFLQDSAMHLHKKLAIDIFRRKPHGLEEIIKSKRVQLENLAIHIQRVPSLQ